MRYEVGGSAERRKEGRGFGSGKPEPETRRCGTLQTVQTVQ